MAQASIANCSVGTGKSAAKLPRHDIFGLVHWVHNQTPVLLRIDSIPLYSSAISAIWNVANVNQLLVSCAPANQTKHLHRAISAACAQPYETTRWDGPLGEIALHVRGQAPPWQGFAQTKGS